jgi:RNA polymerase sigma-70 factor, ECF subfamily
VSTADPINSLAVLFQESVADLTRYFQRRHNLSAEVEDLVQETYLQMARRVEQGHEVDCARGYLFGIARNLSHKAWRAREHEPLEVDVAAPVPDERVSSAREVIEAMPALQREILELRFTLNLSYQEIATALSIPVGTVRSRLHNAVAAVRQRLFSETL